MCYLTTVVGSFHGRVLAARLGAEGVIVVLKGTTDGLYPMQSPVDVLVPADQLVLAREILLADAVDDVFGDVELEQDGELQADESADRSDEQSWESALRALSPVSSGDPSDTFSLRRADPARESRASGRLRGLPAVLVVLVVLLMIVGTCVATLVY
jgi:hypothetical protein